MLNSTKTLVFIEIRFEKFIGIYDKFFISRNKPSRNYRRSQHLGKVKHDSKTILNKDY